MKLPAKPAAATLISLLALAGLAASFSLAASSADHAEPISDPAQRPTLTADAQAVKAAAADFAFDLLRVRAAEGQNILISPSSLSTALAMAYGGAATTTEAEIAKVMRLTTPQAGVLAAYGALRQAMLAAENINKKNPNAMRVVAANRVWTDLQVKLLPKYVNMLRNQFGAPVGTSDFSDRSKTAAAVNQWVSNQTNGLIPVLLSPSDVQPGGMILTNAVYFKGQWQTPFREWGTSDRNFTLADASIVPAKSMSQVLILDYAMIDGVQIARMPYIGGGSMLIILPQQDKMNSLIAGLSAAWMERTTATLARTEVRLQLPKVSLSTRLSVRDTLGKLGMNTTFSDDADFSAMTGKKSHKIADVIQAVRMDVDEEKTEAAAATAVTMVPVSAAPPRPRPAPTPMIVDRPYVMLVTDTLEQIHFIARINDPRGQK